MTFKNTNGPRLCQMTYLKKIIMSMFSIVTLLPSFEFTTFPLKPVTDSLPNSSKGNS